MFFRILKRDLTRKKTMNCILLLFVILATMFLSSSINNLISISNAVDQYIESANAGDVLALTISQDETNKVKEFLLQDTHNEYFGMDYMFSVTSENMSVMQDEEYIPYAISTTTVLASVPEESLLVYEEDGRELILNSNEIALSKVEADNNNLKVGDTLSVMINDYNMEFTVAHIVKDPVFGSEMMGFHRLYINEEDYNTLCQAADKDQMCFFSIHSDEPDEFLKLFKSENFSLATLIVKGTLHMLYIMDMLVAAILIVVSICLILIAFLILRFTILFTLQEDYKEIGVMKALGIKNKGIRKLYLIKYLAISVVGAFIGLWLSFPFGSIMLKQAISNINISDTVMYPVLNVLSAIFIIFIVIGFCYFATCRLKKFSAMEAIRDGSNGETFSKHSKLSLYKHGRLKPPVFLAMNDICSHFKRYIVLMLTFCIGELLILIPLSAINTLSDDSICEEFAMAPSDLYINNGKLEVYVQSGDINTMIQGINELSQEIADMGYENRARIEYGYHCNLYVIDADDAEDIYCQISWNYKENNYKLIKGKNPELENEIELTEVTAKSLGVTIGDTIHMSLNGQEYEMIVCGLYENMNNLGEGARLSQNINLGFSCVTGIFPIQIDFLESDTDPLIVQEELLENHPDYTVMTNKEYLKSMLGDIVEQLDGLKFLLVAIVLGINILITILTMKALITRERAEIAMLKSIGFNNRNLRTWQCSRILIILIISIICGSLLSFVLDDLLIVPIFALMGATQIKLVIKILDVVIIYPCILLLATGIASYLCSRDVKKIDVKEVNNIE